MSEQFIETKVAKGDRLALHYRVAELLYQYGRYATVEHPGCVVIRLDDEHEAWTGLNGWNYATVNVLEDDAWQPDEGTEYPDAEIDQDSEDAEAIAAAWAAWAFKHSEWGPR